MVHNNWFSKNAKIKKNPFKLNINSSFQCTFLISVSTGYIDHNFRQKKLKNNNITYPLLSFRVQEHLFM